MNIQYCQIEEITFNEDQKFEIIDQEKMFNEIEEQCYKNIRETIKSNFEKIDEKIINANWRIERGWLIHDKIKRTIITKFGDVTFTRTKFKNKFTGKYSFLADPYLNINKRRRVAISFEKEVLNSFDNGESQIAVWKKLNRANISPKTISNIFTRRQKNVSLQDVPYTINNTNIVKNDDNNKNIYVDIDDCWTTVRHKGVAKNLRIRVAVAHQGKVFNGYKNELINKRVFIKTFLQGQKCNTQEYTDWLGGKINSFYKNASEKRIVICGDGASWIKEIAAWIGGDFVLDKFHLFQKIYRCFPYKKNSKKMRSIFERLKEIYQQGNVDSIITFLTENLDGFPDKKRNIKEAINYIKNNRIGITNHFKDWYKGCNAESAVSHLIKSLKGYGAKIYSKNTFELMIVIKAAKINKSDIMDYIFQTDYFEMDEKVYKNLEISKKQLACGNKKINDKTYDIPALHTQKSAMNDWLRRVLKVKM